MNKQTKLLLGLGALGVVLYILMKPKKPKDTTQSLPPDSSNKIFIDSNKPAIITQDLENGGLEGQKLNVSINENYIKKPCSDNSNYCEFIIPKGTTILNAKIWGLGQALGGGGEFREGQFEILKVVQDGVKDANAPFQKKLNIGKYELWRGAIVDIVTTQDTTQTYQNRVIYYT